MTEPSSTQGKDSRPSIRSVEDLMAAPTVDTPDTLLSEAGEAKRDFGRGLILGFNWVPQAELLRERDA